MKLNIVIVGVGGQGALTTAAILARAAMKAGKNAITAETHGMAQRGGSVEVHVRIGDVYSPLVPEGDADLIIALEPVEALRYAKYLSEKSIVVLNTRKIVPPSVTTGMAKYPEIDEIIGDISKICKVHALNISEIAEKAGSIQATNVAIIGATFAIYPMPFSYEDLEWAVRYVIPESLHEINLKALKMGYEKVKLNQHAEE